MDGILHPRQNPEQSIVKNECPVYPVCPPLGDWGGQHWKLAWEFEDALYKT